jgi:hypothetical protein
MLKSKIFAMTSVAAFGATPRASIRASVISGEAREPIT